MCCCICDTFFGRNTNLTRTAFTWISLKSQNKSKAGFEPRTPCTLIKNSTTRLTHLAHKQILSVFSSSRLGHQMSQDMMTLTVFHSVCLLSQEMNYTAHTNRESKRHTSDSGYIFKFSLSCCTKPDISISHKSGEQTN